MDGKERINIDEPVQDLSTFKGRFEYFSEITNWMLCLKTGKQLFQAKDLLEKYRLQQEPPGTTKEEILRAKVLYMSAFHPDTGEKQNIFGRMSFQVPGGMFITGAMMAFYRQTSALIFWQWVNQSFNALVNYTNRNGKSTISTRQLGVAYLSATSVAIGTGLGLKVILTFKASPFFQRFIPFAAVAAANCVNIPLMRQVELVEGVQLLDENGKHVANSQVAAAKGLSQVVLSRIAMAGPGMTMLPFLMQYLEKLKTFRHPVVNVTVQTLLVGVLLNYMTPASCALFNQNCSFSTNTLKLLEPKQFEGLRKKCGDEIPRKLYFNKGL